MARLFWVGVGAVGAVVVARKLKEQARRYTPEGVAERADAVREEAGAAVVGAVRRFRVARAERERDLVAQLLVTPAGGDAGAVLGRGRRRADDDGDRATSSRPTGRVDEDEPLYDF